MKKTNPLAVLTGASSGSGFELAKFAQHGHDLVIAAEDPGAEGIRPAPRFTRPDWTAGPERHGPTRPKGPNAVQGTVTLGRPRRIDHPGVGW